MASITVKIDSDLLNDSRYCKLNDRAKAVFWAIISCAGPNGIALDDFEWRFKDAVGHQLIALQNADLVVSLDGMLIPTGRMAKRDVSTARSQASRARLAQAKQNPLQNQPAPLPPSPADSEPQQASPQPAQEPAKRGRKPKAAPVMPELPASVPKELWEAFRAHRTAKKKTMTALAESMIINELHEFVKEGLVVSDLIKKAIMSGWTSIYRPSGSQFQAPATAQPTALPSTPGSAQPSSDASPAPKIDMDNVNKPRGAPDAPPGHYWDKYHALVRKPSTGKGRVAL